MTTIRAKRAAAAIAETKIREALEEIAKADEDERKRIPFSPIENLGGSHGQKRSEDAILVYGAILNRANFNAVNDFLPING